MPISLAMLCESIRPSSTALLLGAGASVPSGAPSGKQLAHLLWEKVAKTQPSSDDLIETASILERNSGRKEVMDTVAGALNQLTPTGGLLGLPNFGWKAIFSTNFDCIVEQSYSRATVPLTTIRSNFDFSVKESRIGTVLYKIHGCVTQDRSFGHRSSMIITEQDYEDFANYRQSMFSLLQSALLTGDVLVIGQSLRDPHLNELVKRVLTYKAEGAPGAVYVLVYDKDDLRAPLLEDRGARIAFGGVDELIHGLASSSITVPVENQSEAQELIPLSIVSTVIQISHAQNLEPNVIRMFNGGSASYADIKNEITFERSQIGSVIDDLIAPAGVVFALVGAGGVGKSTYARQIATSLVKIGYLGYEHKSDFPFLSQPWITYENELRAKNQKAVLVLDECTRSLRQVNLLIEHLAALTNPHLKLILTANAAQWAPRMKSPKIFSKGKVLYLTKLNEPELFSLINLLHNNRLISDLVQTDFKSLSRKAQLSRLKHRCSSDMFVCLKNIFANDSLDRILLTEYDALEESAQDYYRYIAALESVGMRVHRQLIMRMLGLPADRVEAILTSLNGIVDEFTIKERDGIYGWSTRHIVIARKITEYKFSSMEELDSLFNKIIENVNPAIPIELQSLREICDAEYGIGRLTDADVRRALYRRIIDLVPGERIPWHRLIRELLENTELEEAEFVIRDAAEAVGSDAPIHRYQVRLLVLRSESLPGISAGDRLALLRKAFELAQRNVQRHSGDKFTYRTLCDVAVKLIEKGESTDLLDQSIESMRLAASDILDPEMDRELRYFEELRMRIG
jgi:hypothetical protein